MELKDFVKESLVQIVDGVAEAQDALARCNSTGSISPAIRTSWATLESKGVLLTQAGTPVQIVEFDVSVTATEGTGTKGGIGVAVGILAFGSQGQSSESNANTSRLKFSVPLSLPISTPTKA